MKETKRHFLRSLPLLLLMVYAAASVLRLSSSSPSLTVKHPSPPSSFAGEASKDFESLRTHISSSNKNQNHLRASEQQEQPESVFSCSALVDGKTKPSSNVLCCDRSHHRTDVCFMRGDIRTSAATSSILISTAGMTNATPETIRPYTRKWEKSIMSTIDELTLRPTGRSMSKCEVLHEVPGVVFSTGGYTGNVYHEFNDGLLPLFVTAGRFGGEVVLVVLEYHSWWMTKYGSVVEKLSKYKVLDFSRDKRVHCFKELIVGLKIHGELSIDPKLMPNEKGIRDFQSLLDQGFGATAPPTPQLRPPSKPKLAIFVRSRSRVLLNLNAVVKSACRAGFEVEILNPKRTTPLASIYTALSSADAMLAVHGAAVTHFLFMRPKSVLIQIVPLGLDWAADAYYGEPARKLGLEYLEYKVKPEESSLAGEYDRRDPVLADPAAITRKGWAETKKVYLDKQNVRVDIKRFSRVLARARSHVERRLHAAV